MIYDCIIVGAGASGLFAGARFDTAAEGRQAGAASPAPQAAPRMAAPASSCPAKIQLAGNRSTGSRPSSCPAKSQPVGNRPTGSRPSSQPAKHRPAGLILEKTGRAGTKLLMSGGGQCNITHGGSIKDFIDRYGKKGGRIRSCLYKHNNLELISFLEKNGIPTVTQEEDGRVFPASRKAQDIRDLLVRKSQENGFEIAYDQEVTGIRRISAEEITDRRAHSSNFDPACDANDHDPSSESSHPHSDTSTSGCWEIITNKTTFRAKTIILASGGCSYPGTGSDGQLFSVLQRDLDLEMTPLQPALTSIRVQNYPYAKLSGISFKDCRIRVLRAQKKIAEEKGGLLFTHKDFSGPAILNISNFAQPGDTLVIDYLIAPRDEIAAKLQKSAEKSHSGLPAILSDTFHLPKRFSQLLVSRTGNSTKALAATLTGEEFQIASLSGFEKAMTTAGGIALSQIDLKTMELKNHSRIFVCGEMIDIDGSTGGYNLQFAYSSGCTAAESAIRLI